MYKLLTPLRIVLLFLGFSVPVVFLLPHLNIGIEPAPSGNGLEVRVAAPGFSPYALEREVLSSIENGLSVVKGLRGIRSVAREGEGIVLLEFSNASTRAKGRLEVVAALRSVYPRLPAGVGYPEIEGAGTYKSTVGIPVLEYYVQGTGEVSMLRRKALSFFNQTLRAVESVSAIQGFGGENQELQVVCDPGKMVASGVSGGDIEAALHDTYRVFFPGTAKDAMGNHLPLQMGIAARDPWGMGRQPVGVAAGRVVSLSEVAEIVSGQVPATGFFRRNGREVARIQVMLKAGVNSIRETRRIRQKILAEMQHREQDFQLILAQDHTLVMRRELAKGLFRSLSSVVVLLAILFLSYRNTKRALLLVLSLTVAWALSLVLGWLSGLEWHVYTLAGTGVAFGLMMDNAIMMLDACRRSRENHIFPALLTATLSSIAALLMVFLLPEGYRRYLGDFAHIAVIGLLSSLLTVKWFIPACYRLWVSEERERHGLCMNRGRRTWRFLMIYQRILAFCGKRKAVFTCFWILAFGLPVFLIPHNGKGAGLAAPLLNSAFFQRQLRPHIEYLFGGSVSLFAARIRKESRVFQEALPTALIIRAELPPHHTLEHMNRLMQQIESLLNRLEGVSDFYTTIHDGRFGEIHVHFTPGAEKSDQPLRVQSAVQRHTTAFGGVHWGIYGQGAAFSNNLFGAQMAAAQITLRGYDYHSLDEYAMKVVDLLRADLRVANIRPDMSQEWGDRPMQEWRFVLNPHELAARKITASEIARVVRQETSPSQFQIEYQGRRLNIRLASGNPRDLFQLTGQALSLAGGQSVYLKELGRMEPLISNNAIYRAERQYVRILGYEYIGDNQQAKSAEERVLATMRAALPAGFSISGEMESSRGGDGRGWLLLLLLLPCINFYLCALHFESLWKPVLVMIAVPIAFIGVFLAFGVGPFGFDHGGIATFILLGGIAVNAVIFLLHDLERESSKHINFGIALVKAICRRSGALVLTACSAICGLLPFLVEGAGVAFWSALAAGTIGGLCMSLVAVFIVIPVLIWKSSPEEIATPGLLSP